MNAIRSGTFCLLALCASVRAEEKREVMVHFDVGKTSRLVLTSPLGQFEAPSMDGFEAPVGTYSAALETEDGVFFVAAEGIKVGTMGHLMSRKGGIYLPKDCTKKNHAYFFIGSPEHARKEGDFRHDMYVIEGTVWHLEATNTAALAPPNWKPLVDAWTAHFEAGSWQQVVCSDPVRRFAAPAGWLVTVQLAPAGAGLKSPASFPRKTFALVGTDGPVTWWMELSNITMDGNILVVNKPDQYFWTEVGSK
jgi:hypothetical protein